MSNRRELRSSLGFDTGGAALLLVALAVCGLCLVGVIFLVPDVNDNPSNRPDASGVF